MTSVDQQIQAFLAGAPHAVVGASNDRSKFGNKVLRTYLQDGRPVYPVNPTAGTIEGVKAYATLDELPEPVHGISIITPPPITERIIDQAIALGIGHVWMQPGAESQAALDRARLAGISTIAGGPCILVVLGFPR